MAEDTKQLGIIFTWVGWIIGLALLVLMFNKIMDAQQTPSSYSQGGESPYIQITLNRNPQGHYVFNGYVNKQKLKFLVDTGATITSIPIKLAKKIGLTKGRAYNVQTANGTTTAYATRLDSLKLGAIQLSQVRASIIEGMDGDEALLGMNVLKHFELIQRDGQLIIRQYQ